MFLVKMNCKIFYLFDFDYFCFVGVGLKLIDYLKCVWIVGYFIFWLVGIEVGFILF